MSSAIRIVGLLLASLVLAPPAGALDFAPCTESGQQDFECATLTVPLDRSGMVPGSVGLAIQRLPATTPNLPVLIALAGGPGQSATAFASTFETVFTNVLSQYQLVVFDQRGTGLSGVLDCPDLRKRFNGDTLAACATSLGSTADFYTTADSVLDLDDVRTALGVDQVTLAGVSYGTWVAAEYARTFPTHTTALVLDSTVPPADVSALGVESFNAVPRVLRDICNGGTCSFTADPVADTASLVARMAKPFRGTVIDGNGRRQRRTIDATVLFGILQAGDLAPFLQARYPGSVVAAAHRDTRPLFRLAELLSSGDLGVSGLADPAVREDSVTLRVATICADVRFPWQQSDAAAARSTALDAAVAALPALPPFGPTITAASSLAPTCLVWPTTSLARATSTSPLPDVPALILTGTRDLRTPLENADAVAALLPNAARVVVPNRGHSLLTAASCARDAATAFLQHQSPGDPCAALTPSSVTQPPPPRSLGKVDPIALPGIAGRVFATIIDTLNDALGASLVVFSPGVPVRIGGLRAGRAQGSISSTALHLVLSRYVLVPGVTLTGTIDADAGGTRATTKVRGRLTGKLSFGVDGSVQGQLGGRRVSLVPRAAAHGGSLLHAHLPELPPIR